MSKVKIFRTTGEYRCNGLHIQMSTALEDMEHLVNEFIKGKKVESVNITGSKNYLFGTQTGEYEETLYATVTYKD